MNPPFAIAPRAPSGPSDPLSPTPSYTLDSPIAGKTSLPTTVRALLLLASPVGTGGYVTPTVASAHTKSSSPAIQWPTRSLEPASDDATTSPSEHLVLLRRWLSLNVADAARVLRIRRPTIYAWTKGTAFPSHDHRHRIAAVHELASLWRACSAEPIGQRLRQPVVAGRSLFDLLCAETIDRGAVVRAVKLLGESSITEPQRSATGVAKAHGFPDRPERQQRSAVEHATRFRRAAR